MENKRKGRPEIKRGTYSGVELDGVSTLLPDSGVSTGGSRRVRGVLYRMAEGKGQGVFLERGYL